MRILRLALASVALATAVTTSVAVADPAGAKPADKAGDKKEIVSKADAERYSAFFNKVVDVIVANQSDCPKMASGVNGLVDSNTALVKEMNDPAMKNKDLPKEYKDKMEARVSKDMVPALQKKCMADKDVGKALERLGGK